MKILFHYPVLNRGGAEKSLLRLMTALVDRGCEIHLVLTSGGGVLEDAVDPRIKMHLLRGVPPAPPANQRGGAVVGRSVEWLRGRSRELLRRRRFRRIKFDAAVAGITGISPQFICRFVDARKRLVFVRSDPAVDRLGRWNAPINDYHSSINVYVCVSDYVRLAMESKYPQIAGKLVTVYNLLNAAEILAQANVCVDTPPDWGRVPEVLTVCRLQESSKALGRMVEVHRRLLDSGVPHRWHVVGDGADRQLLERSIEANGVSESFILHGARSNPFPYYKRADVCAVLSRFEGLSGAVNEARVLERAVIATRFSGVGEQIQHGVNGLIVEQDVDSICSGMRQLLLDPALRHRLARGGYPRKLLDDDAKVDAFLALVAP